MSVYANNAYTGSGNNPIIAPASDGGLLVQGITDDKGVQVNLSEWPNSKVTINECNNARIHFYGSCGDLVLVRCYNVVILSDGVSSSISMADCEHTNFAIGGNVPPVSMHRSKNCSLMAALDMLREPVETHTCSGITLHALHEAVPNITAEELLEQRMNAEVVEILDGIGLLQRSPVGWHRYQHLIRKAGIGLLLEVKGPDLWGDTRNGFLVKSLIEGYPAQQSGALQVGDELLAVDDQDITGWSLHKVGEAIAGPVGTWCKLSVARFGRPLPTPVMILRSPPAKARGSRVLADQTLYDSGRNGAQQVSPSQLYSSVNDVNVNVAPDGRVFSSQPSQTPVPRPANGPSPVYENSFYRSTRPASLASLASRPPDPYNSLGAPPGLQHQPQPYEEAALYRSIPAVAAQPREPSPAALASQLEQQQLKLDQLEKALQHSHLAPPAQAPPQGAGPLAPPQQPGPVTDPRNIPAPSQPPTNTAALAPAGAPHPAAAPRGGSTRPVEMTVAVMEGRNFGAAVSAESKLAVALQMQVPQQQNQNCRTAAKSIANLSWQEEFKFMVSPAGAEQAVLKCAVVDWGRDPEKGEITGFLKDMDLGAISRDVVLDGWYPVSTQQQSGTIPQVRLRMYLPSAGLLPPASSPTGPLPGQNQPLPAPVPGAPPTLSGQGPLAAPPQAAATLPGAPVPTSQSAPGGRAPSPTPSAPRTGTHDPAKVPRRQAVVVRAPGPEGSRTGIGINFARMQPFGYYQITSLLAQGQAASSGQLNRGEYLWSVDGVEITDRAIAEVAEMIKGAPNSQVVLMVSS